MLHVHELADNLFARLDRAKPHANQSARENFCTEALVWCLRNDSKFCRRFVVACAAKLNIRTAFAAQPQISSQVAVPASDIADGQYDIELRFQTRFPLRIVIERKVDSHVDPEQLARYETQFTHEATPSHLLLLVSDAKRIPTAVRKYPLIYWEKVYSIATNSHSSAHDSAVGASFVVQQFATFLHALGFTPLTIPKLSTAEFHTAPPGFAISPPIRKGFIEDKTKRGVAAAHNVPMFEESSPPSSPLVWFGLHLSTPAYREGWVGLEMTPKNPPWLLFEGVFQRRLPKKDVRCEGEIDVEFDGESTKVRVRNSVPLTTLDASAITRWITTTAAALASTQMTA